MDEKKKSGLLKYFLFGILFIIILYLILSEMWIHLSVNKSVVLASKYNLKTDFKDLYITCNDNENAAPLFAEAFKIAGGEQINLNNNDVNKALFDKSTNIIQQMEKEERSGLSDSENYKSLEKDLLETKIETDKYFDSVKEAEKLFLEGASRPYYVKPPDFSKMPDSWSSMDYYSVILRFFVIRAKISFYCGEFDKALEINISALKCAKALSYIPDIAQHWYIAIFYQSIIMIQKNISGKKTDDEKCVEIMNSLQKEIHLKNTFNAANFGYLDSLFWLEKFPGIFSDSFIIRLQRFVFIKTISSSANVTAKYYTAFFELYKNPSRESWEKFETVDNEIQANQSLTLFRKTMVPEAVYKIPLYADITKLALACKMYHNKNGKYPNEINALVPDFINAIPIDMFSGKEYIYRAFDDGGFVLYSVGKNGKDDISDKNKTTDFIKYYPFNVDSNTDDYVWFEKPQK